MTEQERIELLKQVAKACEKEGISVDLAYQSEWEDRNSPLFNTDPEYWRALSLDDSDPSADGIACLVMLDAMEKAGCTYHINSPRQPSNTGSLTQHHAVYAQFKKPGVGFVIAEGIGQTLPEAIARAFVAVFGEEE